MPLDADTAGTPQWWLKRLALKLQDRRPGIDQLEALFQGDHPLPMRDDEQAEKFRTFQRLARTNYLSLVVEAPLERLRVTGIRTGSTTDAGDKESWALWQSASLDADQVLVHRTALALRRSYVVVVPHPRKAGKVLISPEDPRDVITESWPDDRRDIRAALVQKRGSDGRETAWLYLIDGVYVFKGDYPSALSHGERIQLTADSVSRWELTDRLPNPTPGEIPVVEFANRPGLRGQAFCEFEDVIDTQNRINTTIMHRLVAEKFAVIRQLAILNLEMEEDEDGNMVGPVLPKDPGAAWLLQGEHLQMWESQQTSTADILSGVTADIRDLAAITHTPPHYLLNSIVNASGDALKSAETGLVAKVREHMSHLSDSWEQVVHLAHVIAKIDRPRDEIEMIWADPESRSLAELYDAASKAVVAGEPWATRMRLLGHTPQEIQRMELERAQDSLMLALAQPANAPTGNQTGNVEEDEDDGNSNAAQPA